MSEYHVSDIKSFRSCRWRWDWASPLRQYLEPIKPVPHFLLGRAVHYALAEYYDGNDALEAYEKYIEQDLELSDHLKTMSLSDKSTIVENVVLGRGMVGHYISWCPARDKQWEVLSTEMEFKDRLGGYETAGRFDGVWRNKASGELWLKEFKTTRSMKESSVDFIHRDPQPILYMSAAEEKFGEALAGILYTFMWKKVPEMPRTLGDGYPSKAKNQNTTASLYTEALKQMVRAMRLQHEQEEQAMFSELFGEYSSVISHYAEQEDRYFRRIELRVARKELENGLTFILKTISDMQDPLSYPSPDGIKCPRCPFRDPCIIRHRGGDYQRLIENEFRRRKPYDEELQDVQSNTGV